MRDPQQRKRHATVKDCQGGFRPPPSTHRFGHVRTRAQTLFIVESLLALVKSDPGPTVPRRSNRYIVFTKPGKPVPPSTGRDPGNVNVMADRSLNAPESKSWWPGGHFCPIMPTLLVLHSNIKRNTWRISRIHPRSTGATAGRLSLRLENKILPRPKIWLIFPSAYHYRATGPCVSDQIQPGSLERDSG
jgi:hypothetical protein